jgi:hypothetical protein
VMNDDVDNRGDADISATDMPTKSKTEESSDSALPNIFVVIKQYEWPARLPAVR